MSKWLRTATVMVSGSDARSLARRTVANDRADVTRTMNENDRRRDVEMERRMNGPHLLLGTTKRGRPYVLGLRELESLRGSSPGSPETGRRSPRSCSSRGCARARSPTATSRASASVKSDLADGVLLCLGRVLERMPRAERRRAFSRIQVFKPFERVRGWALLEPQTRCLADHARGGRRRGADEREGRASRRGPAADAPCASRPRDHAQLEPGRASPRAFGPEHHRPRGRALSGDRDARVLDAALPRLGRGVIDGIASRLRSLLATDALRAVFSRVGPPFDVRRGFEPGAVTLVSTGGAELGSDSASLAMSAIVLATASATRSPIPPAARTLQWSR
jgi:hypothetical protein